MSEPKPGASPGAVEAGPAARQLSPHAFLQAVARLVSERLRAKHAGLNVQPRGRLVKFWFGPELAIHYELWLHERTNQIEIGLHCESTPDVNRFYYDHLQKHLLEVQAALGPSFWLEEWDHGWIRLYETRPFWPLTAARAAEIADRLCDAIDSLEPLRRLIAAKAEDALGSLPAGRKTPPRSP